MLCTSQVAYPTYICGEVAMSRKHALALRRCATQGAVGAVVADALSSKSIGRR